MRSGRDFATVNSISDFLRLWLTGGYLNGVDLLDDLVRVARQRKNLLTQLVGRELRCEFVNRSLLDLENEQHDVIWMEQAFHHLEPRSEVLTKISALLRPGGKLVISDTNGWNPAIQLKLFRGRGFKTVIDMHGAPWGNERILSANALSRLLSRQGIQRVELRHFRFFPNKRWADWLISRAGAFDDVDRLLLRPLYTHYNYVGVKE